MKGGVDDSKELAFDLSADFEYSVQYTQALGGVSPRMFRESIAAVDEAIDPKYLTQPPDASKVDTSPSPERPLQLRDAQTGLP